MLSPSSSRSSGARPSCSRSGTPLTVSRPSAYGVAAPARWSRPTSAGTVPPPGTSNGFPRPSSSGLATTPRRRR
eukprot:8707721-Lingulodinium_polyedra.AAC.1